MGGLLNAILIVVILGGLIRCNDKGKLPGLRKKAAKGCKKAAKGFKKLQKEFEKEPPEKEHSKKERSSEKAGPDGADPSKQA